MGNRRGLWWGVCCVLAAHATTAMAVGVEAQSVVPAWVFPLNSPAPVIVAPYDNVKLLHLPNSARAFTEAQLNDFFSAPDWYPNSHGLVPRVVSRGNPPEVYACGYCHSPSGQGRPENASLAGLPVAYIVQQVADFKSGARRSAWPGAYRPADRMIRVATHASVDEILSAAQYFSAQQLKRRVVVVERAKVPRSKVVGWVYVTDAKGGEEPLGERLLEFAPDMARHENRDDAMPYIAYVPVGSIQRGQSIAMSGRVGLASCISCHGPNLKGVGLVPPLAARSPTYILRQLLALQTGARSGATGIPMQAVVAQLKMGDMIDLAAYAGSLLP